MKNFLQNLLMVLALALCGLCAWQWYIQTLLHNQGVGLERTLSRQASEIQGYTNTIKNMEAEISGLSTRITELKRAALANEQAALQQENEIALLRATSAAMSNEIAMYTNVVDKLEAKLKEASEGITKQNIAITNLIAARDDAIKRCNDSIKERNALVEKYNSLVDRFNKLQAASGSNASNASKP
jgi:chromosome segregation ATPase